MSVCCVSEWVDEKTCKDASGAKKGRKVQII